MGREWNGGSWATATEAQGSGWRRSACPGQQQQGLQDCDSAIGVLALSLSSCGDVPSVPLYRGLRMGQAWEVMVTQHQVWKEEAKRGAWSPGPAGLWLLGRPGFPSRAQAAGFIAAQADAKSIHVTLGQTPHSPWSGYFQFSLCWKNQSDLPLQNCESQHNSPSWHSE